MPSSTEKVSKQYTVEDVQRDLRAFEERWGMPTSVFLARWRAGELDVSEFDFVRWDVAAEEYDEFAQEDHGQ